MYKSLIILQLSLMLLGCSSSAGSKEVITHDSAGLVVGTNIDQRGPIEVLSERQVEEDTSQLNTRYDELREAILLDADALYQVSVSTKQYEAVSDVT